MVHSLFYLVKKMKSFKDIGVQPNIEKSLADLGFEAPTLIQEKVVPALLDRQGDLVSLAQTGTGKTAAFGIPLVQLTETGSKKTQALVLCPTRELCVQVARYRRLCQTCSERQHSRRLRRHANLQPG